MANKRNLKKQIQYICGDVAAECLMAGECFEGVDPEAMRSIVVKIALLQENALESVSFSFDKIPSDFDSKKEYNTARAAYFRKAYSALREKFNNRLVEIVKEMNAALPQSIKDANKKA